MNLQTKFNLFFFLFFCLLYIQTIGQGVVTELRSQGYTIYPAPQKVELTGNNILIDGSWKISSKGSGLENILSNLAARSSELHNLTFSGQGTEVIELKVKKGAVENVPDQECAKQAYKITINEGKVLIEGNEEMGLFYGVQSFLQLLKPTSAEKFMLPAGVITDWPDLELRFIHWDTKHHRDKVETLKRQIDWLAYFKVNAIAFEIEDKYEYPSHPIIGAPNAFTKEEMQELTKYAMDRFIQLVPNVQAPSHMAFVLKHKEFEHLRADESNYHICMCDEEAMELIFDMYQDMIDATPDVDYFFVSTDEVYYAGICGKCDFEYNDENRSQTWVEFLQRVNKWMNERDRRVLAWVEYPLLPKDISKVPENVIDAIMGRGKNREWTVNETKAGLDQLSYTSMQGAEYLFPNYFPSTYRNNRIDGRLADAYSGVSDRLDNGANLIGTFAAAWDDAGLHNETFWLGWASVTQYGWTNDKPSFEQNNVDFLDVFYGLEGPNMLRLYAELQEGARFYESMWDKEPTKERGMRYGSSRGKGIGGPFDDLLITPPPLPSGSKLGLEPSFKKNYNERISEAKILLEKNDWLIAELMRGMNQVKYNSYNLEVLLSIAYLERYAFNTLINFAEIESLLVGASKSGDDHTKAMDYLINAYRLSEDILKEQNNMWEALTVTWEKSRLKKGASVDGKDFYHEFDDVKDHFADRRKGLEYMLAPFERIGIPEWKSHLKEIVNEYAEAHDLPVKGLDAARLED
ncbi:MAG: beta-N-acetylhexosaminidase [Cyclobacteriaceae bacterium]